MTDKRTHTSDCDWHVDQYPWECTCGFISRKKAMDDLIAQDADLIDNPLVAAVRELLTDDSVEHLDVFTHNLVQALDKHGLKVVSTDYLDNLNDTVRGLRLDICETQAREIERLREALEPFTFRDDGDDEIVFRQHPSIIVRCEATYGDIQLARAALAGDSHDQ